MAKNTHRLESEALDLRLRCPKDGTLMEKVEMARTTVDRCNKCGSLWLDKNELERLLTAKAAEGVDTGPFGHKPMDQTLGHAIHCPRDHEILVEVADAKQKHVLLMLCPGCGGKLLDAGELLDLQDFTMVERIRATLKLGGGK